MDASEGFLVQAENLSKTYRPRDVSPTVALRDVSLGIRPGESIALVGPSGCGKSTLLSIIGTLDHADTGHLQVMGLDVQHLSRTQMADLRFRHLGFIFQQYHLFPGLTVLENLLAKFIGRPRPKHARAEAENLLNEVGLSHKRNSLPKELSGGEQQRVCIARALLSSPALILADEPTGNLDSENGAVVLDLMLRLVKGRQAGLLMATHEKAMADSLDRSVEMRDGAIVGNIQNI